MRKFARLYEIDGRQYLAFMLWDASGYLKMIVQYWDDDEDHQVQAEISFNMDDTDKCFDLLDTITEDSILDFVQGVQETLSDEEAG